MTRGQERHDPSAAGNRFQTVCEDAVDGSRIVEAPSDRMAVLKHMVKSTAQYGALGKSAGIREPLATRERAGDGQGSVEASVPGGGRTDRRRADGHRPGTGTGPPGAQLCGRSRATARAPGRR